MSPALACSTRTPESSALAAPVKKLPAGGLRIGAPSDTFEHEADNIAAAVLSGCTAPTWSLGKVRMGQVQRQPAPDAAANQPTPAPQPNNYQEGAAKLGEAFLQTDLGKKLKDAAMQDPLVKDAEAFWGTLGGKIIVGTAAAGTVSALAATHTPLPMQIPEIPLDAVRPGLKVKLTYEGPVDRPTKAMITFSYSPQGEKKKPAQTDSERYRAETARIAADQDKFRAGMKYAPGTPEAKQQEADQKKMDDYLARRFGMLPGTGGRPLGVPSGGSQPTSPWSFSPVNPATPDKKPDLEPAPAASGPTLQRKYASQKNGAGEERAVQPKDSGAVQQGRAPPIVHHVLRSPGQPLDGVSRAFMEPRFGHDFSNVRVHVNAEAAASARAVNALAYTVGRDIVFGANEFNPGTDHGRRLLAHELAHTLQQGASGEAGELVVQRKAMAVRFQDEPTLDEISDGKKVLKEKDKGEAVIRVTTALSELGYYNNIIDENFDPPLTSAVQKYQAAKSLKGKALDGEVDKPTFDDLDQDFSAGFAVERNVLSKQKSPDLLAGTQSLDAAERTASNRAISTEVKANPVTGLLPTFQKEIPGKGKYEDRLRDIVEKRIIAQFNALGKDKAAQHAKPSNLYSAPIIDAIADLSKKATDKVFGEYKQGPALKFGTSVFDAWTHKVNELAGGKAAEDSAVDWRVTKILTGDDKVAALDAEHGAIQSRAEEKAIVDKIKNEMIAKHRAELLETHKGWPGFEDQGKVFMQLFKGGDARAQRLDMWKDYQMLIHEYIHSLEHPNHIAYRSGMTEQKGDKTLREGTTDYFTKIVWNSITVDDALRKAVEGALYDAADPTPIRPLTTYRESENAERLAGVVGVRNVAAAFFLGKVDLIGKT